MKKYILFLILTMSGKAITAQTALAGKWKGDLEISALRTAQVVMNIAKDPKGDLSATFDDPARKVIGVPCDKITLRDDSLIVSIALARALFAAKINADTTEINGFWTQGDYKAPLTLQKIIPRAANESKPKKINPRRPQTPEPPFDYVVEDLQYNNADQTIRFGATLTKPKGEARFPVALLITGSGRQDRDETMLGHKPFAVIADYLTKRGIAVLRVDDRGAGKTTGNFAAATTADFAKDVESGIAYLKTRADIDPAKIGLIGHSEGGMIAIMLGAERKNLAFIVLLAAPGIKNIDLLERQGLDLLRSAGAPEKDVAIYQPLYKEMIKAVLGAKDSAQADKRATHAFKNWQAKAGPEVVLRTTNVTDAASLQKYIAATVRSANAPWYKYFVAYDPADNLRRVACPVLALNGSKDIQVASAENLAAIKAGLAKSPAPSFRTLELQGLNHLFQRCAKCSYSEYGQLEETFSPDALTLIGDWIIKVTK